MSVVDPSLLEAFKQARRRVGLYSGLQDVLSKKDRFRADAAAAQLDRVSAVIGREIERSYSFQETPSVQVEDGHLVVVEGKAVHLSPVEFAERRQAADQAKREARERERAAAEQARQTERQERAAAAAEEREEQELLAALASGPPHELAGIEALLDEDMPQP